MGISIIFFILCFFALILVSFPRFAGKIFSNDEEVLDLFEAIRMPFALMMIFMNFSVACEIIMGSMGLGPLVFKLGLIGSWLG
jgi:Na+-driven multidrug efflux pump